MALDEESKFDQLGERARRRLIRLMEMLSAGDVGGKNVMGGGRAVPWVFFGVEFAWW